MFDLPTFCCSGSSLSSPPTRYITCLTALNRAVTYPAEIFGVVLLMLESLDAILLTAVWYMEAIDVGKFPVMFADVASTVVHVIAVAATAVGDCCCCYCYCYF